MLKKVRIKILTDRAQVSGSLFENTPITPAAPHTFAHSEMSVEGRYHDDGVRVTISYDESELSGLEGSRTTLSFHKDAPAAVKMLRTGSVKTALLFEAGKRHECVYQTPYGPFEVRVQTNKVHNATGGVGALELDYIVEIKGAEAEHTKMKIVISPAYDQPRGI